MKFPGSLVLVTSLVLAPAVALAQTTSPKPPPSAHQLELAHRYVEALHMQRTLEASTRAMLPSLMASIPGDAEEKKAMAEDTVAIMTTMREKMYPLIEPIVAETFTEAELEPIVAFYESRAGQTLIAKQPEMTAKLAPVMKTLLPEVMAEMMARVCARHPSSVCPGAANPLDAAPKPKSS